MFLVPLSGFVEGVSAEKILYDTNQGASKCWAMGDHHDNVGIIGCRLTPGKGKGRLFTTGYREKAVVSSAIRMAFFVVDRVGDLIANGLSSRIGKRLCNFGKRCRVGDDGRDGEIMDLHINIHGVVGKYEGTYVASILVALVAVGWECRLDPAVVIHGELWIDGSPLSCDYEITKADVQGLLGGQHGVNKILVPAHNVEKVRALVCEIQGIDGKVEEKEGKEIIKEAEEKKVEESAAEDDGPKQQPAAKVLVVVGYSTLAELIGHALLERDEAVASYRASSSLSPSSSLPP